MRTVFDWMTGDVKQDMPQQAGQPLAVRTVIRCVNAMCVRRAPVTSCLQPASLCCDRARGAKPTRAWKAYISLEHTITQRSRVPIQAQACFNGFAQHPCSVSTGICACLCSRWLCTSMSACECHDIYVLCSLGSWQNIVSTGAAEGHGGQTAPEGRSGEETGAAAQQECYTPMSSQRAAIVDADSLLTKASSPNSSAYWLSSHSSSRPSSTACRGTAPCEIPCTGLRCRCC